MTTVQISLPEKLAREAQQAGLLSSERIEQWVREQLRQQKVETLFSAMERMDQVSEVEVMSAEDMAEEVREIRRMRRYRADS